MQNFNFGGRESSYQGMRKETRDMTPEELEANLRAHGAPAAFVARAVDRHAKRYGYSRKQTVAGGGSDMGKKLDVEVRVAQMLDLLRKTERAVGKALTHAESKALLSAQRDTSPTYQSDPHQCTDPSQCYHCMRSHLRTAYDLAEASYAFMDSVNDMLDSWPGTGANGDLDADSLRDMSQKAKRKLHNAFKRMHREAHRMMGETCALMYQGRLTVGQIED